MKINATKVSIFSMVISGLFAFWLPAMAVTENAYRWRNDDGSETGATFSAAENAPLTSAPIGLTQRVRFGAANNGSESELLRKASVIGDLGDHGYWSAVIDTAAGFAYFATNGQPARIVKFDLATFTRVGNIDFGLDEGPARTAVIDTVNGFAYFGVGSFSTTSGPAKIIKIRLSDFTRVATLTLGAGELDLRSAVIDAAPGAGFAYFGTGQTPAKIIKIDLSTFTELPALTPGGTGENGFLSAVIDTEGLTHYAYFGSNNTRIVKINLSTFTKDSTLTTAGAGETNYTSAIIDTTGATNYAYFGSSSGRVVKIDLGAFANVGPTITLPAGEDTLNSAAIDPAGGFAYFGGGAFTGAGRVIKINLATFTRDSALTLSSHHNSMMAAVIDPAAGFVYLGTLSTPGRIVKVQTSPLTQIGELAYDPIDTSYISATYDPTTGFAYFGTATNPGRIAKIRVSDMTHMGNVEFLLGEANIRTAVIDEAAGFAYFGTDSLPAYIVKVDLSTFTRVGAVTMPTGQDNIRGLSIDVAGGFLYASSNTTPTKVSKISLASFTETASLPLTTNSARTSVIDIPAGFLYVASANNPATLAKVSLATFTQVGAGLTLTGINGATTGAVDTAGVTHFAYFGANSSPGQVAKVDLSTFTLVGANLTTTAINSLQDAVIDMANGFLYFGSNDAPGKIAKIRLSDFSLNATLTLTAGEAAGEQNLRSAAIDVQKGFIYFGTNTFPGRVVKVSIAPKAEFRLEYGIKAGTCAAVGSWTQVPTVGVTEHWQMTPSLLVTDATATTNSSGLTDDNVSFQAGQFRSSSAQTTEISLGEKQFSELEYSIKPTEVAQPGTSYCFRLTNAGSPTGFTYSQYAEVTASPKPPSGSGGCSFIIRPNGGEILASGQGYEITWSHSACTTPTVRLSLSTDGGASYPTVIAANEPEDGSYLWTVPNTPTTSAKVRLEALGAGNVVESTDASDGDFTITGTGATVPPPPPPTMPPPPPTMTPYNPAAEQAAATSIDQDQGWTATSGPKPCVGGSTFKAVSSKAVYYCGSDGRKHVFPNEKTYKTWYVDFSRVITFSDAAVASIPEGEPVTYKPGVKMIKLPTDAKTYAVAAGGVLRWVTSEAKAGEVYGTNWNTKIDDMPPSIFDDYSIGEPI